METWLSGRKRSTPPRRGELLTRSENNMAFVYIIRENISHRYYIGSCLDLDKRIKRHNQHNGAVTTRKGVWNLVCYKRLDNLSEARELEKKVKSYKSGNAFRKIVNGDVAEWSKAPHC